MVIFLTVLSVSTFSLCFFLILATFLAFYIKKSYQKKETVLVEDECAIILPCKGANSNLEENIRSFYNLNYSNYKLFITVESENDSAIPIIKKIIEEEKSGELVIAGEATKCGQKNHNLLAAVKKTTDAEILIFADSDIKLFPSWITALTAPLNEDVTAVTGFRWLYSSKSSLGDLANVFQNIILYILFSLSSATLNIGLWGGSMAIRKKDFVRLDVEKVWGETTVDDMSLSQILTKNGEKSLLAYDCITPTSDTISSYIGATKWFRRQVMYLKAHQKLQWSLAIFAALVFILSLLTLPYSIFKTINGSSILESGILIGVMALLAPAILVAIARKIGNIGNDVKSIIFAPISMISTIVAIALTLTNNTIIWSGIKYKFRLKTGVVTKVERL
jgi:ceramide glucosyltransferase